MPTVRSSFAACSVLGILLATTGCLWAPGLSPLYRDLGPAHTGGAKDSHFELRLGRLSMALAHALTEEDDDESDELAAILSRVHGLEISVTEFEDGAASVDGARFQRDVERLAKRYGWLVGASVMSDDSAAMVLYQGRRGTIKNVYLAVRESDSLVLARFRGQLDREFFEVLARQGDEVKAMARDEGTAPSEP
jgi:Domain of unknown function (DUF4252)